MLQLNLSLYKKERKFNFPSKIEVPFKKMLTLLWLRYKSLPKVTIKFHQLLKTAPKPWAQWRN